MVIFSVLKFGVKILLIGLKNALMDIYLLTPLPKICQTYPTMMMSTQLYLT